MGASFKQTEKCKRAWPGHAFSILAFALLSFALAPILQGCGEGGAGGEPTQAAKLIKLEGTPGTTCLDGSPGAFYYREAGNSSSKKSWIISLEGGGECVTKSMCEQRRSTHLGSSKNYPSSDSYDGFLSAVNKRNPDFANWNHVRVKYCSGDLHMGNMSDTASPKWGWARFNGARIVRATLDHLVAKHSLSDAEHIIWTGESAGGIGSVAHLDDVADRFPKAQVVGAPIGGYYWDDATFYRGPGNQSFIPFDLEGFKYLYELYDMHVPSRCATGNLSKTPWACAMAYFSFPTLSSPIFVIEAQLDKVQLELHAGLKSCNLGLESQQYCLQWGANMTARLGQVVERATANPKGAGIFSPACYLHVGFKPDTPMIDSKSYLNAFGDWFLRARGSHGVVHMDACCSGDKVKYNPTCPDNPWTTEVFV